MQDKPPDSARQDQDKATKPQGPPKAPAQEPEGTAVESSEDRAADSTLEPVDSSEARRSDAAETAAPKQPQPPVSQTPPGRIAPSPGGENASGSGEPALTPPAAQSAEVPAKTVEAAGEPGRAAGPAPPAAKAVDTGGAAAEPPAPAAKQTVTQRDTAEPRESPGKSRPTEPGGAEKPEQAGEEAAPPTPKSPDASGPVEPATTSTGTETVCERQPAEAAPVGEGELRAGQSGEATAAALVEEAPAPPPPPPKPEWKVLEPEDQDDPVEHEICDFTSLSNGWKIFAASVRGKLHAHRALWRDDAYAFDNVDGWTILAMSDGAGSAKKSRIGARIACDDSVGVLREMLAGYTMDPVEGDRPSEGNCRQLQAFLTLAACAARDGIIREAHKREVTEKDLYCTLLVLIHAQWKDLDVVAAIQVGDGAVGVFDGQDHCTLVGVADHGEYSSETVFLTSWSELVKLPYDRRVLFTMKKDVRCIALMSDGVSDDFFPEERRLIELFIGNPIQEIKTKAGEPVRGVMFEVVKEPREGQALVDWLRYEKKGSSDDRTLLLMYKE